jgi:hypothetical protein
LQGTYLQNSLAHQWKLFIINIFPDYIFVGDFAFGFSQYSKDSRKSAKGKLALKGMIGNGFHQLRSAKKLPI